MNRLLLAVVAVLVVMGGITSGALANHTTNNSADLAFANPAALERLFRDLGRRFVTQFSSLFHSAQGHSQACRWKATLTSRAEV